MFLLLPIYFLFLSLAQEFFGFNRILTIITFLYLSRSLSLFFLFCCKKRTTRCFEKSINWWDFEQVQYFFIFLWLLSSHDNSLSGGSIFGWKRNKTSRILIENDVNLSLITHRRKKTHKFDAQFFGWISNKILLYYELKKLTLILRVWWIGPELNQELFTIPYKFIL